MAFGCPDNASSKGPILKSSRFRGLQRPPPPLINRQLRPAPGNPKGSKKSEPLKIFMVPRYPKHCQFPY